jgi:hypothetical protein
MRAARSSAEFGYDIIVKERSYLIRLGVSASVVGALLALVLFYTEPRYVLVAPWFFIEMVLYWNPPQPSFRIHPAVYAALTLAILAMAARRKWSSVLATVWFSFNAIGMVRFLSSYDGHS